MTELKLSIVMPTRNRKLVTLRSLEALRFQRCGYGPFEVIVADDGSEDGSLEALSSLRMPYRLRVLSTRGYSNIPSAALARNLAIQEALGDIILFLDCDMIAHPDLVSAHLGHHRQDGLGVAGYRYRATARTTYPSFEGESPPDFEAWPAHDEWVADVRALQWKENTERKLKHPADWTWLWTCNASVRRDRILAVGGFDLDFDGAACQDADLGYRLQRAGLRFVFAPDAVAFHQFHEHSPAEWRNKLAKLRLFQKKHPEVRFFCEQRLRVWKPIAPAAVLEEFDKALDP